MSTGPSSGLQHPRLSHQDHKDKRLAGILAKQVAKVVPQIVNTMPSSSDTGVSDTLDPIAIVSDNEILSESEVYTGDLPLLQVPAPLPLAVVPLEDLPHDEFAVDDIDLFLEGPPEGDQDGVALMDADVPFVDDPVVDPVVPLAEILADVPIADSVVPVEAPIEEAPFDLFSPYSFESVASASLHTQGIQHYASDSDSEMAMSVAPHDVDPDPEVEFLPDEPAPVGLEPVVSYDPIEAPAVARLPDPLPEPAHVDIPDIAPPVIVAPIELPPVSVVPVIDAPVIAPVVPVSAPVHADHASFASHIDPHYADTRNGWIEDDDYPPFVLPVTSPVAPVSTPTEIPLFHPHTSDVHRTDLPITFLQDIPPPVLGRFPHTAPSFVPKGEPFLWASPDVMPLSDPYHPYHVGYTIEDILISLQLQHDALSHRIQELERALLPPCHYQTPFAAPHTPLSFPPDSDVCFLTSEQQIAYLLRVIDALEED
ncbi:proline-rich extensin-like protein EPR1 [Helianthus annuus]|uniref:proline-rich extensin-like protein EPR1 n=1 Tax=Helianthus annuus TaxID=4232 RepID=UPI000B908F81|nr:proline-rich extensin-like protein EPR1 [Helianthus annuus]